LAILDAVDVLLKTLDPDTIEFSELRAAVDQETFTGVALSY